jgi:hypothetical protein
MNNQLLILKFLFSLEPLNLVQFQLFYTYIIKQSFPVKIMIDQKQLENVESFRYLGSILTKDGRCICEIKCRIDMVKAAFNKKGIFLLAHWTWN